MADLVQWLTAQLDADERIARAAADYDDGATHDVEGPPGTWLCLDEAQWFGPSYRGGVIAPRIGQANAHALGAHIVAHDPARVLREVEAKRQQLALHSPSEFGTWVGDDDDQAPACRTCGNLTARFPCKTLRLLASVYADRPGYQEGWRP